MTLDDTKLKIEVLQRFHRLEWSATVVAVIRAIPSLLCWIGIILWLLK